jgi:hypothetical protein
MSAIEGDLSRLFGRRALQVAQGAAESAAYMQANPAPIVTSRCVTTGFRCRLPESTAFPDMAPILCARISPARQMLGRLRLWCARRVNVARFLDFAAVHHQRKREGDRRPICLVVDCP